MSQHNHNKKQKSHSKKETNSTQDEVVETEVAAADASDEGSSDIEVEVIEVTATESPNEADEAIEASSSSPDEEVSPEKEQVRIEFPYSEIIREKAPKAFEVAEKVATDWKNEGDFTDLGITHPVAGIVASQALMKAKEVEKKLEEKGVFTMAKLGLEIAKSQVETIKSKIGK